MLYFVQDWQLPFLESAARMVVDIPEAPCLVLILPTQYPYFTYFTLVRHLSGVIVRYLVASILPLYYVTLRYSAM